MDIRGPINWLSSRPLVSAMLRRWASSMMAAR